MFREPKLDEIFEEIQCKRPRPIQSRYQAYLPRDQEHPEDWLDGEVSAISWLTEHVRERQQSGQVLLNLNDGERSIWNNVEILQDDQERVDILDAIHGIQCVWDVRAILDPDI